LYTVEKLELLLIIREIYLLYMFPPYPIYCC
jgi:hypothetical protein